MQVNKYTFLETFSNTKIQLIIFNASKNEWEKIDQKRIHAIENE